MSAVEGMGPVLSPRADTPRTESLHGWDAPGWRGLRVVVGAARLAVVALVQAEEDVALVVRRRRRGAHGPILGAASVGTCGVGAEVSAGGAGIGAGTGGTAGE